MLRYKLISFDTRRGIRHRSKRLMVSNDLVDLAFVFFLVASSIAIVLIALTLIIAAIKD